MKKCQEYIKNIPSPQFHVKNTEQKSGKFFTYRVSIGGGG